MNVFQSLPLRNVARKPVKSFLLGFLVALLALAVFGGLLLTTSLQSGMDSLNRRLGADIMVVPEAAAENADLQSIVLQGSTGYFYMDRSKLDQVAALDGIDEISAQIYLASASAGCCSAKVQIMGFDPETDFTIRPWVQDSFPDGLGEREIIIGSDLSLEVGEVIKFYDVKCTVAGKLQKTGTHYDTCVFANNGTVKTFIAGSLGKQLNQYADIDPEQVISCILIKVRDGYRIDDLVNEINLRVDGVTAIPTTSLISGISDGLAGISTTIGILIAAAAVLAFVILALAFAMMINERKKEFAVLRVIGVSRRKLAGTVWKEVLLLCGTGGICGVLLGFLIIVPFNRIISAKLALPFLLPGAAGILGYLILALVIAIAAGSLASFWTVRKISRLDAGLILREGQ